MKFVNGWRYLFKDGNRINMELRIGILTLFRLYADFSDRVFSLTLINFTLTTK